MDDRTIFDEIIEENIPTWKIWEDDNYLAFLTPMANTPGQTVVIPKKRPGVYVFDLDDAEIAGLMSAARKVAKLLEKGLGARKVALVFEGEGVAHVHAKLYPMHGLEKDDYTKRVHHQEFYPEYPGWISTVEGPGMGEEELDAIQLAIKKANNEDQHQSN